MGKMKKYMMVHNNLDVDWQVVKDNWRKLATIEDATWVRTYYNEEKGIRFCIWMTHNEEELKDIFTEIGISWETITQVEETIPDVWIGEGAEALSQLYYRSSM